MKIEIACPQDAEALADLRVLAMRESLEDIGRFNVDRARQRFLSMYLPDSTSKILLNDALVGFYVVSEFQNHLYVDHLYIHPAYQGEKIGSKVLAKIIEMGKGAEQPIKLGALKQSRSNRFYQSHGFIKVDEGEYDNYYEFKI